MTKYRTLGEAQAKSTDLNGDWFPVVGRKNGNLNPTAQQTTSWYNSNPKKVGKHWVVEPITEEAISAYGMSEAQATIARAASRNNGLDYTGVNATLPALSVVGNKIKANGVDIQLKGVSLPEAGNEFANGWGIDYCEDGLGQFTGMNIIRVPCAPAYLDNYGIEEFLSSFVDIIVEWAETNSVYSIIDYHAIENWDTVSVDTSLKAFWDIAATRYKNLPHVLFEIFNEPITSTALGNDWVDFKPFVQGWVDYVRAIAPDNIILVPTPLWCQKVDEVPASPLTGTNLVYVEHIYPGHLPGGSRLDYLGNPVAATTLDTKITSLDGKFGDASDTIPVFISEWGYDLEDGGFYLLAAKDRDSFGQPLTDYMNTNNINWTAWTFSHLSAPKMTLNESTFDLTDFGLLTQGRLNEVPTVYDMSSGLPAAFSVNRGGTTATYRDSNGEWQLAAANEARLQHNAAGEPIGIVSERSRVNKANHKNMAPTTIGDIAVISGDGSAAVVADATVSAATIDGSTYADLQNGNVIALTGGTVTTAFQISAQAGNTNKHSFFLNYKQTTTGYHGTIRISDGTSQTTISKSDTNWYELSVENATIGNSIRYLQVNVPAGLTVHISGAQFEEYHVRSTPIVNSSATGSSTRNADIMTALVADLPFTANTGAITMVVRHPGAGVNQETYAEAYKADVSEVLGIKTLTNGFIDGDFKSGGTDQSLENVHKILTNEDYPSFITWGSGTVTTGGGRGMRFRRETGVTSPVDLVTFRLGNNFEGIFIKMVLHSNTAASLSQIATQIIGPEDIGVAIEGQSNAEGLSRATTSLGNGGEIAAIGELDNYYTLGTNFVSNGALGGAGIYYRNNNTLYYLENDGVTAGILTTQAIERINAIGSAIKFLIVNIGETDIAAETEASFKSGTKAFIDLILAGTHLTDVVLIPHGRRTDNASADVFYQNWTRAYQELATENANYHLAPPTYDLAMLDETGATDSVHISDAGQTTNAVRVIRKGLDAIGETVTGGLDGPLMTGATLTTDTVTVTIAHDTGTDFTPTTAIENFKVFDTGGVSVEYTINAAVRASATTITLTLDSTPGGEVDVYYGYGVMYNVDPAQTIRDNSTEALPLQMGVVTTV